MRLTEFTDSKHYMLSTDDMASLIKRLKRVWHDFGIDADAPSMLRLVKEPKDVRRLLTDAGFSSDRQPLAAPPPSR